MHQLKKIIILFSSTSLGLAVLFLPFFKKINLLQKNNDQRLVNNSPEKKENNQQLPKKKKKSSVLQIILIIIGIIIFIFIIFLIIEKRKKTRNKKPNFNNKIKNYLNNKTETKKLNNEIKNPNLNNSEELKKYLSGKMYVRCLQENEIIFYFCPYSLTKNNETDRLFDFDIHKNEEEIPPELKEIYRDLKNQEKNLKEFGKVIGEFFNLLDGNLLKAVYQEKNKAYSTINGMFSRFENHLNKNQLGKDEIKFAYIPNYDVYDENNDGFQLIDLQEGETSIDFFLNAIDNEGVPFFKTKNNQIIALFKHYRLIYEMCYRIAYELNIFFSEHEDYKNQYEDNIQKAIEKIKYFFAKHK